MSEVEDIIEMKFGPAAPELEWLKVIFLCLALASGLAVVAYLVLAEKSPEKVLVQPLDKETSISI